VARIGEGNGVYRDLVGRPEGERPLGRPKLRWEDNINMVHRESGIDGANWIRLGKQKTQWWTFVSTVVYFRFHREIRLLFDKLSDYQLFKEHLVSWSK